MGCRENYDIVDNPSRPDRLRALALANLVRAGCIEHLFDLVDNPDRPDWIRDGALAALCAFAQGVGSSVSAGTAVFRIGEETILMSSLRIDYSAASSTAAESLYRIADNPDRPDRLRRAAVNSLVAGRWARHCHALADNPDRPDWLREAAIRGM